MITSKGLLMTLNAGAPNDSHQTNGKTLWKALRASIGLVRLSGRPMYRVMGDRGFYASKALTQGS